MVEETQREAVSLALESLSDDDSDEDSFAVIKK
jgi:hypothetical protein